MLKSLKLENFRNHKEFSADFNNTTILIGLNGSGKTGILEAISLISAGRSFRIDDKKNLVNLDADLARIKADDLELIIQKTPRLLVIAKERGVKKKLPDFIGTQKSVIFSPEIIEMITGAPALRRRFLDIMISQNDKEYLLALSEYTKVRRQRNGLLEMIKGKRASESELLFWDDELEKQGKIITKKRIGAIEFLNNLLSGIYQEIAGPSPLSSRATPTNRGNREISLSLIYHNSSGEDLAEKLRQNRAREIAYGATIYGPHRDDLEFKLDNANMQQFASRGELRSAILALKIAELKYLEKESIKSSSISGKSDSPILLLDDIFSEFDAERRSHLNDLILQYQSVITTTDREHLNEKILKEAKIIEL